MKPYYQSDSATVYCADVLEALREMPDESVHCCMTSPPYWSLRDYGVEGQIGLEPSLEEYIAKIVEVFAEVRRVLRKDGTLWLNMGDCYNAGRDGGHPGGKAQWKPDQQKYGDKSGANVNGLKPKDLVGLPWRVAFALQADGWWLRSDIIWNKPTCMPESVRDRPTRSHEYIFLLTKRPSYFYDQDAIRVKTGNELSPEEYANHPNRVPDGWATEGKREAVDWNKPGINARWRSQGLDPKRQREGSHGNFSPPGGRNARTVWRINPEKFPDAHFATFPQKLVEPCVKAGTSERGCCAECGAPWIRETSIDYKVTGHGNNNMKQKGADFSKTGACRPYKTRKLKSVTTIGWQPTCGCGTDIEPDDLETIESPTGEVTAEDPSRRTGRAGMNRPRGPDEGKRLITRWQQRRIAEQLRSSPYRAEMKSMAGPSFSHYIRTDRAGARPPAPELLEKWIACGWVTMPEMPEGRSLQPIPCTVLDPFAGSLTTGVVALKLGRHFVGIELSQQYLDDFGLDRLRAAETGLTAREVRAGQQALFNGGETK